MSSEAQSQKITDFDWDLHFQEQAGSQDRAQPAESAGESTVESVPQEKVSLSKESPNLELLLDIPLEISVELGRTRMIINDLLQLGQGSVIELNKLAGEPLEILINQKLIARGEVVVVNEKFGIRLTDIISPMERIKQLS